MRTCWIFHTFIPIPILRFWGSVTDVVGKHRLRSKDGTAEEVGTNDEKNSIQLNGLPSGYKVIQFLKAAL